MIAYVEFSVKEVQDILEEWVNENEKIGECEDMVIYIRATPEEISKLWRRPATSVKLMEAEPVPDKVVHIDNRQDSYPIKECYNVEGRQVN